MLDQDPAYVVRRFESGKYAVDSDVRSIYLEVHLYIIFTSNVITLLCFSQAVEMVDKVS